MAIVQKVRVEAIGPDFAQVCGQWLTGTRIAAYLSKAEEAWVFSAADEREAASLAVELSGKTQMRVVAIAPGRNPGWPGEDVLCLRALLPQEAKDAPIVGLLVAAKLPACESCGRAAACEGGCAACGGTNAAD